MSETRPALEIHIHLVDSHIVRYVQADAAAAQKILDHLQPTKLFAQRSLLIAGEHSMTAYPCAAVVRVDLVMEGFPRWSFPNATEDVLEITSEEFQQRYDPHTMRIRPAPKPGETMTIYSEIELDNGERLFVEAHTRPVGEEAVLPLDRGLFLQQLLAMPALFARRRGGGAILLNPDHIVRLTLYPGPADTPPGAWTAHRVAE